MSLSYAGDRLQELAQAWLVATLTSSALAVAAISILSSIPQLLTPLGGVIGDRVNRIRLLMSGQWIGAVLTLIIGLLIVADRIALWHIYAWACASGLIWLFSRPAYKVVLTELVPGEEVRSVTAINSMTETSMMVIVAAAGSLLLGIIGLPIAFLLNSFSYLAAGLGLRGLSDPSTASHPAGFALNHIFADLRDGFSYFGRQPNLLHPLLLTLFTVMITSPTLGLLAAIVHAQGGSIISLGLLSATSSVGALLGAVFAGIRSDGASPTRRYALYGIMAALAVTLFAILPIGPVTALPLGTIGFILFSEAVWNTSRVRLLGDRAYQARIQALTTMVFTIGGALGQLWGGIVVDRFGPVGLIGGAIALGIISIWIVLATPRRSHEYLSD
jgi:MFS family permease